MAIAAKIKLELETHNFADPNPRVPKRIRKLAEELSVLDHHAAIKARELADLAGIFYSARKHENYRGGPGMLQARMKECLRRIESQAEERRISGD